MNNKEIQEHLIRLRILDPPSDGEFGPQSKAALADFQHFIGVKPTDPDAVARAMEALPKTKELYSLKLTNNLASRIVKYMLSKNYFIASGSKRYNIVYLEGCNADGALNPDTPDHWNDRRIVIEILGGVPKIVGNWLSSTEPGSTYTHNPMNPEGAARIAFGQYKSWSVGFHKGQDALVQVANVKVHRDGNKDFLRGKDPIREGIFGLNQHTTRHQPALIGGWSAGCLVGQSEHGHKEFMALIKKDRRYQVSNSYIYMTTVIDGVDFVKKFPA